MIIETRAFARAGLLGNPSDGYFGKTISISVRNFGAQISLYASPELRIEQQIQDRNEYRNIYHLIESIDLHGYYGGDRLIKAAIKKFYQYSARNGIKLESRNFTVRYNSNIPRQVGLAGSSAIITATMRALCRFFNVEISRETLPSLILAAEREELGINAGLQDRVIQVYEGCVYMDFNRKLMEKENRGRYEPVDPKMLPRLYIAYRTDLGKVSGVVLNDIRVRFERGEPEVISGLNRIAAIAEEGKNALLVHDHEKLDLLINENFDQRRKIMQISKENLALIEAARSCGASAKFCGSGGSIIGIYKNDEMLNHLFVTLKKLKARVMKPFVI